MRRAGPVSRAGSVCRDLGTSVKHTKNQLRDYMEKSQPGQLGSRYLRRLDGLKIYHVIVIAGPTLFCHLISLQSKLDHQKVNISLYI